MSLKTYDGNACRCGVCSGKAAGVRPIRDRRALAEALGDLVAEALVDYSESDRMARDDALASRAYEESLRADGAPHCPPECPCRAPRTFNSATYAVLGEGW